MLDNRHAARNFRPGDVMVIKIIKITMGLQRLLPLLARVMMMSRKG